MPDVGSNPMPEARFTIRDDHPAFAGHFPGRPIVPGVVLLDEALHALCIAGGIRLSGTTIASAKFLRPVGPGAALTVRYARAAGGNIRVDIFAGEHRVATAALSGAPPAAAS